MESAGRRRSGWPGTFGVFSLYICFGSHYNDLAAERREVGEIAVATFAAIRHLLGDVDKAGLDVERHKAFIIDRVLKFGTPPEVPWLQDCFS